MGSLWEQADLSERHGILKTMLDTVYIDVVSTKAVVGVVPKPAFYPLFAALHQRPEAGVYVASPERIGRIVIAPDDDGRDDFWVWWRRGRDGLCVTQILGKLTENRGIAVSVVAEPHTSSKK